MNSNSLNSLYFGTKVFLSMTIGFILSCATSKPIPDLRIFPQEVIINSIKCNNLSEDMSPVSTYDDELLIKIDFIKYEHKGPEIITNVFQQTNVFKHRGEIYEINKRIQVNQDSQEIIISLIELDENDSQERVVALSDSLIMGGVFTKDKVNIFKIDSLFGYNDFLGLSRIKLYHKHEPGKNINKIKGMQIFDRFEYEIHFEIK